MRANVPKSKSDGLQAMLSLLAMKTTVAQFLAPSHEEGDYGLDQDSP
jgi:hypothetical protein